MLPPRCTCDNKLKGISPCPVHGILGKEAFDQGNCCTVCGGELGYIRICNGCVKNLTEATAKPHPISSTELTGYAEIYDKYNGELISAIGIIAELQTTQRAIADEEYTSVKATLEAMRDILFSLKA